MITLGDEDTFLGWSAQLLHFPEQIPGRIRGDALSDCRYW